MGARAAAGPASGVALRVLHVNAPRRRSHACPPALEAARSHPRHTQSLRSIPTTEPPRPHLARRRPSGSQALGTQNPCRACGFSVTVCSRTAQIGLRGGAGALAASPGDAATAVGPRAGRPPRAVLRREWPAPRFVGRVRESRWRALGRRVASTCAVVVVETTATQVLRARAGFKFLVLAARIPLGCTVRRPPPEPRRLR